MIRKTIKFFPLYIIVYIHIIVYIFFKIKILTSRALDVSCMCSVRCEIMHLMMVELIFCYFLSTFFSAFMFPFQLFLLESNSIFLSTCFSSYFFHVSFHINGGKVFFSTTHSPFLSKIFSFQFQLVFRHFYHFLLFHCESVPERERR